MIADIVCEQCETNNFIDGFKYRSVLHMGQTSEGS